MLNGHREVLVSREKIAETVAEIGAAINRDYANQTDRPLVVVSLLKGAMVFTADLIRHLEMPIRLEVMVASSYGDGTVSTRQVNVKYQSFDDLEGCDVLLVDDITDSGNTLKAVGEYIKQYKPASVRYCSFLDKPSRREVDIHIDYIGLDVPDEFVIGYGLDYAGNYRELADICVVRGGEA
ncbi:hypoxanthine phosphoribosyltransferase [Peptococcus simiae]|uniref:Hypoxanthine phosphoribosyltransferase n=1 Tax=Peptococcus simiae TaxID=1643805 RepID=A0ABW9GYA0_9FIRM